MITVLLVVDALAAYKVGVLDRRPPHFSVGGRFLERTGGGNPPSYANGPFSAFGKPGPPVTPSLATSVAQDTGANGQSAGSPSSVTTTGPVAVNSRNSPTTPTTLPAPASNSMPATGTYVWDVNGTETATGFGSRSFPPQMTMVAHKGTSDPQEIVLDLTYSSDHQEREIIGCRADGLFFDYEAGQIRFGPMAQSNQGNYNPPILQVPLPLATGRTYSGTSNVIASDGSTERTEAWTVHVDGPVNLQIGGQQVATWQVTTQRNSLPGSSQTDNRTETYWFDPARHLWVKFAVKQHGQQTFAGFTVTYDEQLVATLASFTPG